MWTYTVLILKLLVPIPMHISDVIIEMIHRYNSTYMTVIIKQTMNFFSFGMCSQIPLYFL